MADAAAAPAAAPAAPAAAPQGGGDEERQGFVAMARKIVGQMMMMYFLTSLIRHFTGGPSANTGGRGPLMPPSMNLFPPGQLFDLYLYLDYTNASFVDFNDVEKIFWIEKGLKYGDWTSGPTEDGIHVFHRTLPTPSVLQRNGSLFLHVFITKSGQSPNPMDRDHQKRETIYEVKQLNKFKKKHYKKTTNLLTGESQQSAEDLKKAESMSYEVLNYWHPNITVNLVDDQSPFTKGAVPPPLDELLKFSEVGGFYYPLTMFNTFWNLDSEYMPINETVKEVNLTITYQPLSLFKFNLYASQMMRSRWSMMLGSEEPEDEHMDSMKQALLETNPILLGVTVFVSFLHMIFECLAFKNDIQFWKTRQDLSGLSVRSVLFNIFQSVIVFLYICDNDTNTMVKFTVGIGLFIECWKIPKVLNVEIDHANKIAGLFPRVKFSDKGTYVQSETKIYDEMAFKYLSWLLFPLFGGYAVYSLLYEEQRGWYSWVLNMLYGFLLTFGFITMTPQLFINYKLKSVAHLPWRMLTYKFINTFIDDLFAFVIRTPLMYRIGCFRDDIIFLIYLYQRWIYRVDPKRVNEFGIAEDPNAAAAPAAIAAPVVDDEDEQETDNQESSNNSDEEETSDTVEESEEATGEESGEEENNESKKDR